jgi:Tol biopolymer transport system component
VKVYARPGYRSKTTKAYRFTPTTPIPPPAPAGPAVRDTTRVSVRSDGGQANAASDASAVSADGRWIAYTSKATNLVDIDTNGTWDVFLFDRDTGLTQRVSVNSHGDQANYGSGHPAISADGRWIAYDSGATNLVDDDSGAWDVYLLDRDTGLTQRVSVHGGGNPYPTGSSRDPAVSADGRWIAYSSDASDLVDDDTNNYGDVFLFDRETGLTQRVSVRSDGGQTDNEDSNSPAISADGRWIVYISDARNLVDDDTNYSPDVFLFDRDTGLTERVSVRSDGGQATNGYSWRPAISADGRWISYVSSATNLVDNDTNNKEDVFLFDRDTGLTRRVSVNSNGAQANGESRSPAISADGRWITYNSSATNLVKDDTNKKGDVFLFDRDTGLTQRVSVRGDGGQAGDRSLFPAISADGRWISYKSLAANLVDNDTNTSPDVFLARMW